MECSKCPYRDTYKCVTCPPQPQGDRLYGLTLAERQALRASQNDRCGICGRLLSTLPPRLVQLDHKGDKARGYLCNVCNSRLIRLEDDWLEKAAEYLRRVNR